MESGKHGRVNLERDAEEKVEPQMQKIVELWVKKWNQRQMRKKVQSQTWTQVEGEKVESHTDVEGNSVAQLDANEKVVGPEVDETIDPAFA